MIERYVKGEVRLPIRTRRGGKRAHFESYHIQGFFGSVTIAGPGHLRAGSREVAAASVALGLP